MTSGGHGPAGSAVVRAPWRMIVSGVPVWSPRSIRGFRPSNWLSTRW
ncbi:hypothetical protein [Actinophytocola gossypii]|uniref:Uncharacterized protein n=1 Tax=Actinophytocola gossypii TaxID=2812003 RepID=A0ABT2JFV8_9PSEU|nr:hypothetical protein [Actinophytocola gossypii]MCT2586164.1 hypothetical protein [Actinophytocola gossypii]